MKKLISVKLDPDLLEWITKQADKENRSRNNYIENQLIAIYEITEEKSYSDTIGKK